jgi:hypothetical protein
MFNSSLSRVIYDGDDDDDDAAGGEQPHAQPALHRHGDNAVLFAAPLGCNPATVRVHTHVRSQSYITRLLALLVRSNE